MTKKEDELLTSNYDGIQEYDNDLPRWWQVLFLITIVFGIVYASYVHLIVRSSSDEELQVALKEISAKKQASPVKVTSENELLSLVGSTSALTHAKEIFIAKCAPCHGAEAQGIVGPNLVDDYWIHGGKITDVRTTIEKGVIEKGMLSWKGILSDEEIDGLAAYIFSIKGTTPANPKAPQGDKL